MNTPVTDAVMRLEDLALSAENAFAEMLMDGMTADELSLLNGLMALNTVMVRNGHGRDFRRDFLADTEIRFHVINGDDGGAA